jgi:hypothetical protein
MFGIVDSRPTQAATRFFKERRVTVTFVDLKRKPIALGELRRFVERLGAAALLDTEGRAYKDLGLASPRQQQPPAPAPGSVRQLVHGRTGARHLEGVAHGRAQVADHS